MFKEKGGYTDITRKLSHSPGARHTLRPSQAALDALHHIQETGWSINEAAMLFVEYLQDAGKLSLPVAPFMRHTALEWSMTTPQERKAVMTEKRDRRSAVSKHQAIINRIQIAQTLRAEAVFYQPHFFDFRGRSYPMNTEFNNQADHYAKGMMQFERGTPLGPNGLRNLKRHVANAWGHDKLSLAERDAYVDEHIAELIALHDSHEEAAQIITQAAEPLAFYAAAYDLVEALNSGTPDKYVSRIPCAVDGTCNGLQVLSLLGHDPVGAHKTNCTGDPGRQDVYMEIADLASACVSVDADSTESIYTVNDVGEKISVSVSALARAWQSHLADPNARRKAVKRAIMTTAYGVSNHTIANNLVEDGIVDQLTLPDELAALLSTRAKGILAAYFRDKIVEARRGAIKSAVAIMGYFTRTASQLGAAGKPLRWTTPDGLQVVQSYRHKDVQRFQSANLGRLRVMTVSDRIDARKAGSGAAPQVVHSLDATMLRMVAVRLCEGGYR